MRLLDLARTRPSTTDEARFGADWYGEQLGRLWGGDAIPAMTWQNGPHEDIEHSYEAYVERGLKRNGIVYAVEQLRVHVFSEARFAWQRREQGRAQPPFTDQFLAPLEQPWPGGTTQDLLQRMLLSADMGGNAYVTRNRLGNMRVLRPDWITIVRGSEENPEEDPDGLNATLLGYLYKPGGHGSKHAAIPLLPEDVAHFAPMPDPVAMFRGMSWLTPVVREIVGDTGMTEHKNRFLENAGTPNLVVRMDASVSPEEFEKFKRLADERHSGLSNAYKTMYLGGGADVTVAGSDLKQLDFKVVQGHGETRIAAAAGVHPVVVGLSEGMQGSSLNAGNYSQARRNVADTTFHPLWRNAAAALSRMMRRSDGAELIADVRDVPFLRQDEKDAADVQQRRASTVASLISSGFTPESAVEFAATSDWNKLEHTGMVSVQLQKPGSQDFDDDGVEAVEEPTDE